MFHTLHIFMVKKIYMWKNMILKPQGGNAVKATALAFCSDNQVEKIQQVGGVVSVLLH